LETFVEVFATYQDNRISSIILRGLKTREKHTVASWNMDAKSCLNDILMYDFKMGDTPFFLPCDSFTASVILENFSRLSIKERQKIPLNFDMFKSCVQSDASRKYLVAENGAMMVTYKCSKYSDVIIALLAICAEGGLITKQCEHCGRWFSSANHQSKFCDLYSALLLGKHDYKKYTCRDAARKALQDCNRKRAKIVRKYCKFNEYGASDVYIKTDTYFDAIRSCASMKNFRNCWNALEQIEREGVGNGVDQKDN